MRLRGFLAGLLVIAPVAALLVGPRLVWQFEDPTEVAVAVVDLGRGSAGRDEQAAMTWLAEHRKLVPDADEDGGGPRIAGSGAAVGRLGDGGTDLLYVADGGGGSAPEGRGGLRPAQVTRLERALRDGGILVTEHDVLTAASAPAARRALAELVGVEAGGWVGRRVADLADETQVPAAIRTRYQQRARARWNFGGGGILLLHRDGRVVVLADGPDLTAPRPTVRFTPDAQRRFGVPPSVGYTDAPFDVVRAVEGTDMLAWYDVPATEAGRAKLTAAGVPRRIPALLQRSSEARRSVYIAGEWAEHGELPPVAKWAGYAQWRAFRARVAPQNLRDTLLWQAWVPVMESLLADAASDRPG